MDKSLRVIFNNAVPLNQSLQEGWIHTKHLHVEPKCTPCQERIPSPGKSALRFDREAAPSPSQLLEGGLVLINPVCFQPLSLRLVSVASSLTRFPFRHRVKAISVGHMRGNYYYTYVPTYRMVRPDPPSHPYRFSSCLGWPSP